MNRSHTSALLFALLLGLQLTAHGSPCPSDLDVCPAGRAGPGGCYSEVFGGCIDGVVFESGKAVCPKGTHGAGGTYDPHTHSCALGVVFPQGMAFCPGPNGQGAIYPPLQYSCQNGNLAPRPAHSQALPHPRAPRYQAQPPIELRSVLRSCAPPGQKVLEALTFRGLRAATKASSTERRL